MTWDSVYYAEIIPFIMFIFTECDNYGSTFKLYENISVASYNHFNAILNLADCKQACLDMGNACGSVDYRESTGDCWPQTVTYQQTWEADPSAIVSSDTISLYSRYC